MLRFILAFSCFFRLLFGMKLNPQVVQFLPEEAKPKAKGLPPREEEKKPPKADAKPEIKVEKVVERVVEKVVEKVEPAPFHREGALALLGLLQREGRLIDFLQEKIETYADADIGAAVRDIHRGCRKVLVEHVTLEPVMPGAEEDAVTLAKGFDPGEIRIIGEVKGDPPFKGVLRHHGWRATDVKFPTLSDGVDRRVIAPAEVEIGG
jgi:hypothetical protein